MIAYKSKRLPEAASNYSITELEVCGVAVTNGSFTPLLKRVGFEAIVDHLALMHIIKSKVELTTTRIKRLLGLLSSYSFNLYYIKGKDMVLSDFFHPDRSMMIVICMKLYLFHLICKIYYRLYIII